MQRTMTCFVILFIFKLNSRQFLSSQDIPPEGMIHPEFTFNEKAKNYVVDKLFIVGKYETDITDWEALALKNNFNLLDRRYLQTTIDEMKLQQSGLSDDKLASAANLAGADGILIIQNDNYYITGEDNQSIEFKNYKIRLISAKTGEVIFISTYFSSPPSPPDGYLKSSTAFINWKENVIPLYHQNSVRKWKTEHPD